MTKMKTPTQLAEKFMEYINDVSPMTKPTKFYWYRVLSKLLASGIGYSFFIFFDNPEIYKIHQIAVMGGIVIFMTFDVLGKDIINQIQDTND